ncbi:HSP20-like chaperone [Nitzschia inconspicua]|uniref:HSP20-like chaperone n=1 Tax=Nitzschia inconspicua TaxID=303405 RepID=A0A9K3LSP7_9STRA|nr:HSP20-like chaperone [Nitzschia inconspicua]
MSKLSDYSKFDNLDDENDSDDNDISSSENHQNSSDVKVGNSLSKPQDAMLPTTTAGNISSSSSIQVDPKNPNRYYFEYKGQRIYDFQQELDQMTIFVKPPPHIQKGSQIKCEITAHHLKVGLVGNEQWYLNEDTFGTVDVDESTWSLEDDDENEDGKILCIYLTKANRGTVWDAALKGNPNAEPTTPGPSSAGLTLNAFHKEQVKKDLMLQRFQEENPGFDFRGAEFNGSVPDPRNFMGGVKYN